MAESELTLGKYLKELRHQKRMSLLQVSSETHVGYSHLSRIESNSAVPGPETVVRLAAALDGDLTTMLELADNLPRAILDRLRQRDASATPGMRRAMPGDADAESSLGPSSSLQEVLESLELSPEGIHEMKLAISGLARLTPRNRRLMIDLISSYFPEGDDATG